MANTLKAFGLSILAIAIAACTTLETPTFADEGGAIRGHDPVAYHLSQKPVRGDPKWSVHYNNASWYFASEANRDLFRADPERYAPQYGGYCAYAMSGGRVVPTDPQAWHIEAGKLYLNYSRAIRDVWIKDVPAYVKNADRRWAEKVAERDFE